MQKVYLLLRSNKQTGPYSLEELLQLNLKPFDLVWVEGRSAAWQYPSEIPALKPYVPETPRTEVPFQPIATSAMEEKMLRAQNPDPQKAEIPKRVFVSVPKTNPAKEEVSQEHAAYMPPAEQPLPGKEEQVRLANASYSSTAEPYLQQKPVEENSMRTNYTRSLNDVEEDYTHWIYTQKTKKKTSVNPKDLVLTVLILAVIGGGYYIISRPSVANSVLPSNKTATQSAEQPVQNAPEEASTGKILSTEQTTVSNTNKVSPDNTSAKQEGHLKMKNRSTVPNSQTNSSVPQVQNSMPIEKTTPNIHDNNTDIASTGPQEKQQPAQTAPTEKKKKLGDVLKSIFSKKEKKEEPKNDNAVLEDPKPANNRQSTRRETEEHSSGDNQDSKETGMAGLTDQIDLYSNAPDSWMMGVKNLKITLRNRSDVAIQTASVTVNYYDENNQLLDKKLVYFSNVAPKSKATVAAPDHKFADHVDFKLASVSAKEDRYAKY